MADVKIQQEDIVEAARRSADAYGVFSGVHPDDHMFSFMSRGLNLPLETAVASYFLHGSESHALLMDLINRYRPDAKLTLLEFASGYGCVTRFVTAHSPDLKLTSCDIHPAAVEFLRTKLQVQALQSSPVPEELEVAGTYDIVFVLSLFSHLPKKTWSRWLYAISRRVKPGGLLIFTTHGMHSAMHFGYPRLDAEGYWFHPLSEQEDLKGADYGSTITTFDFVHRQISDIRDFRLLNFQEGFWRKNQDVYVLEATTSASAAAPPSRSTTLRGKAAQAVKLAYARYMKR